MVNHHIQKTIIYKLAFNDRLRFTDLKPDSIDNKLFDYHLKITVTDGFVQKDDDGLYSLTPEGRRLGLNVFKWQLDDLDRGYSVLFLLIRRKSDKAWLLHKRPTHPLINKIGFVPSAPSAQENAKDTARKLCSDKLGIKTNFSYLGGGFLRIFENHTLESFTNFTLLVCEDAEGDIKQQVNEQNVAEYFWSKNPDFSDPEMLPAMQTLVDLYEKSETFFIEKSFDV